MNKIMLFISGVFLLSSFLKASEESEAPDISRKKRSVSDVISRETEPPIKRRKTIQNNISALPQELTAIPDDIWSLIFQYVGPRDYRSVCRHWNILSYELITNLAAPSNSCDEELQQINLAFPNIKILRVIEGSHITDNALKELTNLTNLTLYHNSRIQRKVITCAGVQQLTNLRSLCWWKSAYEVGPETLIPLRNLQTLGLDGVGSSLDDGFIAQLTNLTCLGLWKNRVVTEKGVENLTNLTSLSWEGEDGNEITLNALSKLSNLKKLGLHSTNPLTYEDFQHLTALKFLNNFDLTGNTLVVDDTFNDAILRQFTNLTRLKWKRIHLNQVHYTTLRYLTKLTNIYIRDIYEHGNITAEDLQALKNLTCINNFKVNQDTLKVDAAFNDALLLCFTNLTSLDIQESGRISNTAITQLTNLTDLNIGWGNRFSYEDLQALKNLRFINGCYVGVDTLFLSNGPSPMFNEPILLQFTNLTNLHLPNRCSISVKTLRKITSLTSLNGIMLNAEEINALDLPLKTLRVFTNLKKLNLSDEGYWPYKYLKNVTNLTSLRLARPFDEDEIDTLWKLTNLTHIDLGSVENINAAGLFSLPNLKSVKRGQKTAYFYSEPTLPQ